MNRREIIQYIRQKTVISEEQKIFLINLLYKHSNNFGSLCRWVKSLNILASDTFQELFDFQRSEVVRDLIRDLEERISNETLVRLLEIFFGNTPRFSKVILNQARNEKKCQVRALLIQLLLHFDKHPIEGSHLQDYLSGLNHQDEVFRCKVLHFLYRHYGEESLSQILQEVVKIDPHPSLFFSMTLNHYLRSHPEIRWDEGVRRTILPGIDFSGDQTEKDRRLALFQQMQFPILRHEFLSIAYISEAPEPPVSRKSDGNQTRWKLERFEKIESLPRERFTP